MFDVSFTELLIIGIVALIVIGPEKLPKVARTVGHLLGRAQRYVSDVKREIKQEIDAAESLGGLKKDMEDAMQTVKRSVDDTTRALRSPLEEAQEAMRRAEASLRDTTSGATAQSESGQPVSQAEKAALPDQQPVDADTSNGTGQEVPSGPSSPGGSSPAALHPEKADTEQGICIPTPSSPVAGRLHEPVQDSATAHPARAVSPDTASAASPEVKP